MDVPEDSAVTDTVFHPQLSYKLITGFEYLNEFDRPEEYLIKQQNNIPARIRTYRADPKEAKTTFLQLGYSNEQFNSPVFASFYPVKQGLYNGSNLILLYKIAFGCGWLAIAVSVFS